MSSHNKFPPDTRFIFQDAWCCWYCGENTADCLHHIMGRGNGDSTCESSMFNAASFCNQKCHLPNHGRISTDEWKSMLLKQTKKFLIGRDILPNKKDKEFMEKYKKYYKN